MTLLSGVFLTEQSFPIGAELPSRIAVALPRAYEAGAVPVIASIIFLALIVAAVGGAIWNQRICFSAKLSPPFGSFDSALIGAFSMSICDNVCLASGNAFSLTLLCGVFLAGQSYPPRCRTAVKEALEKVDDTAR